MGIEEYAHYEPGLHFEYMGPTVSLSKLPQACSQYQYKSFSRGDQEEALCQEGEQVVNRPGLEAKVSIPIPLHPSDFIQVRARSEGWGPGLAVPMSAPSGSGL